MKLRILFTLAILAGLAAAPGAQTFRWEAGRSPNDIQARVHTTVKRALDQATRQLDRHWSQAERQWSQAMRQWERQAGRTAQRAERAADRIERRVRARVDARINRDIRYGRRDGGAPWAGSPAQGSSTDPCGDTRRRDRDRDHEQHCEVRDETLPGGALTVDASPNGGISVEAWDQDSIRVRAIVRASAGTEARAKELAAGVQIQAGGGRVSATGPDTSRREWWSVSYRVSVPRKTDLDLNSLNGGISIKGVTGRVAFDTNNGGVTLADLGGDVRGRTRNGGVTVTLAGKQWDGPGLDVETTNGGVTVAIPDGYNAEFEARTHNGGFRTDYPITVTGELNTRRGISTTLGSGGAPVRVRTSNGGLKINHR